MVILCLGVGNAGGTLLRWSATIALEDIWSGEKEEEEGDLFLVALLCSSWKLIEEVLRLRTIAVLSLRCCCCEEDSYNAEAEEREGGEEVM